MPSRPYALCDRPGCGYPAGECSGACLSRPAAPLMPLREPGAPAPVGDPVPCHLFMPEAEWPLFSVSDDAVVLPEARPWSRRCPAPVQPPVCPPCTGACNQGRACVARAGRPDPAPPRRRSITRAVALVLAFASAAAAAAAAAALGGALTPFQSLSAAVLLLVALLWAILSLDERSS